MQVSKNKYSSKRFLVILAILSIVLLSIIGTISYIVDPFMQFRVKEDSKYLLNPRLVNGGLIRNYTYNTAIIGSSMTQNYNLEILRRNPDVKPVKIATGGMNIKELEFVYSMLAERNIVNHFIINLDIPQFNLTYEEVRYPLYLYENGFLNKLNYLFGYDTFIRYVPVDLGLSVYLDNKKEIPLQYKLKTNIDDIGNNSLEENFNAEHVKKLFLSGKSVSHQLLDGIDARMQQRLDTLLNNLALQQHQDVQYTFVLPPYSALYWYNSQKHNYYNNFIAFIRYMTKAMDKYSNVRIVCFFDIDEITNLNNYTDITHFSTRLSDKILENIDNQEYFLNMSNVDTRIQRLDSLVSAFQQENKSWLKK